ncbi:hypothetical protein VTJ04DRAFT_1853 [Mycothermus thermophilus]|uniref:uncharacterized protein n=1 Tax=Humicola insolens TaxID=85995 RepID=UPI0037445524
MTNNKCSEEKQVGAPASTESAIASDKVNDNNISAEKQVGVPASTDNVATSLASKPKERKKLPNARPPLASSKMADNKRSDGEKVGGPASAESATTTSLSKKPGARKKLPNARPSSASGRMTNNNKSPKGKQVGAPASTDPVTTSLSKRPGEHSALPDSKRQLLSTGIDQQKITHHQMICRGLNELAEKWPAAMKYIVDWYRDYDPNMCDLEGLGPGLEQLNRANTDNHEEHPFWKDIVAACQQVSEYIESNKKAGVDVWNYYDPIPYFPDLATLRAARFFPVNGPWVPTQLQACLRAAQLDFVCVRNAAPSGFWTHARLGDESFRQIWLRPDHRNLQLVRPTPMDLKKLVSCLGWLITEENQLGIRIWTPPANNPQVPGAASIPASSMDITAVGPLRDAAKVVSSIRDQTEMLLYAIMGLFDSNVDRDDEVRALEAEVEKVDFYWNRAKDRLKTVLKK